MFGQFEILVFARVCQCGKYLSWLGSEDEIVVVLQDYPSAEISEPIYRMGEKLKVIAQ